MGQNIDIAVFVGKCITAFGLCLAYFALLMTFIIYVIGAE